MQSKLKKDSIFKSKVLNKFLQFLTQYEILVLQRLCKKLYDVVIPFYFKENNKHKLTVSNIR